MCVCPLCLSPCIGSFAYTFMHPGNICAYIHSFMHTCRLVLTCIKFLRSHKHPPLSIDARSANSDHEPVVKTKCGHDIVDIVVTTVWSRQSVVTTFCRDHMFVGRHPLAPSPPLRHPSLSLFLPSPPSPRGGLGGDASENMVRREGWRMTAGSSVGGT